MNESVPRRGFLLMGGAAGLAAQAQDPRPIRLGVIGTGTMGLSHLATLMKMPEYSVVAMADPTPESRDKAATLVPKAAVYTDYKKLLEEQKELDAVLIVAPDFLHAEMTVAAFARGHHVFCEKPMALRIEDANRMIEAGRKAGKLLEIGHEFRHTPIYQKMAELVRDGAIGKVQYVTGHTYRGDWNPKAWRYTDPKTGKSANWRFLRHTVGTSLLEDGIHVIDVLHGMVGSRVTRVIATGGNSVLKDRETIDHAGILIDYENGVKFQFGFSLFSKGFDPQYYGAVIGTEGIMRPEGSKVAIRKPDSREPKLIDPVQTRDSGALRQFKAFAESVRTGRQPLCDGQLGKEAIKISLLAQKSIDENRIVKWSDLPA